MKRLLFSLILTLLLTACGDATATTAVSGTPEPLQACNANAGDAPTGKALFEQDVLTYYGGCITCHTTQAAVTLQGPSLQNIATIANSRVAGQSNADYLCQSILQPNAYLVEGFEANQMPPYYANWLSQQELDDIVAYLLTLD